MKIFDALTFKTSASGKKRPNSTCCHHGYRATDEQCWHLFLLQLSGHCQMFKRQPQENISVKTHSTARNITSCHVTPPCLTLLSSDWKTHFWITDTEITRTHHHQLSIISVSLDSSRKKEKMFIIIISTDCEGKTLKYVSFFSAAVDDGDDCEFRCWAVVASPSDQRRGYSKPRGGCGHPNQRGQRQLLSAAGSARCGGELTSQTSPFWRFKQTSWMWTR